MGPYPVGFDTIAFYVPNTLDWAAGKVGLLEMLGDCAFEVRERFVS